jgi:hypothetical protein
VIFKILWVMNLPMRWLRMIARVEQFAAAAVFLSDRRAVV